jgi:Fe-S cluster biogenesis protein NfuA
MAENKNEETVEEKIDAVLEKLRPFLAREGGNIRLSKFDKETGICYVIMEGACSGCYLAASDVSDSIEVMLMDEIPEITKVKLEEDPNQAPAQSLMEQLANQQKAELEFEEQLRKQQGEQNPDKDKEGK